MKTLTRRNIEFIKHYVITKVGSKAAILAGYSPKNASETAGRLLRIPEIKQIIQEKFAEIDKKLDITPQEIVDSLIKEAKSAEKCSDRIRALELLSKIKKMYNDNETNIALISQVNERLDQIAQKRLQQAVIVNNNDNTRIALNQTE